MKGKEILGSLEGLPGLESRKYLMVVKEAQINVQ